MNDSTMMALNTAALQNLSVRERKLWNVIRSNAGVLMAYGIPGISKSATFNYIAKKLGMQYIELRTSTMDETDLGSYPTVDNYETPDGRTIKVVDGTVPKWAIKANEKPTLIHFEELNRCPEQVRSAALGILNEKVIGAEFKFNKNVFMVASGNPATDHDMDVEEFGSALRNRLVPIQFSLTKDEWFEGFANEHVVPEICNFIEHKPEMFGNTVEQLNRLLDKTDNTSQYPSPRSWTFLSDYFKGFEQGEERNDAMLDHDMVQAFVGEKGATSWVTFITAVFKVSVKDILSGKADIENIATSNCQRLLTEFQDGWKIPELKTAQLKNWSEFVEILTDTLKAGHISILLDHMGGTDNDGIIAYSKFLKPFGDIVDRIDNAL